MQEQEVAEVVLKISHGMRLIAEALADLADMIEGEVDESKPDTH